METESRFLVARGSEQGSRGEWLLIGVGFLSGMKCSRIRLVIVVQLYDYANKHWIVHIKMVNFMACKLYLLRVPWTARRSNQSILKEISPEYSLEGLVLKLKLQYFGHLMRRNNSMVKTLILGKTEGRRTGDNRGWRRWMALPTRWTWAWANSRRRWRKGSLVCCSSWGRKELNTTEQLNNKNKYVYNHN